VNIEDDMSELGNSLKVVLADTFGMFVNTWNFHWNVEGPNFYEYHKLFGQIYEELFEAIDTVAEQVRALDEYAPGSYSRFKELSTVDEETKIPTASNMIEKLLAANDKVIASLNAAMEQAKIANNEGVINFLGGRLEIHAKHGWFLRSTSKKNRA
jgi:starvation-inducible DNA-binding protein